MANWQSYIKDYLYTQFFVLIVWTARVVESQAEYKFDK